MHEDWVKLAGRTAWFLGLQLTIASVFAWLALLLAPASLRDRPARRRSLVGLASVLGPVSLFTGVLGAAGWFAWGRPWPVEPRVSLLPGAIALAGAWGVAGAHGLLLAGRLERRGAVRPARRLARHAGLQWFLSAATALPLLALSRPHVEVSLGGAADDPMRWAGLASIACSGSIALLAGLSGKPRPSAAFASGLWVAGWTLVVAGTPFAV